VFVAVECLFKLWMWMSFFSWECSSIQATAAVAVCARCIVRMTDRARHARKQEQRVRSRQQSRALALEHDDGRLQAYGWSLPSKFLTSSPSSGSNSSGSSSSKTLSTHVAVPVPVYCRPVSDVAGVKASMCYHIKSFI